MTDLSVIIPSYNTKDITSRCLDALIQNFSTNQSLSVEIIVVDNASTDGSKEILKRYAEEQTNKIIEIKTLFNKKNLGYSKANNQGIKIAKGKYILLLNSDAIVDKIDFNKLFAYFDQYPMVGGLTVRVNLANGDIDQASHRGLPTVWNSFCYFGGLEKIFGDVPGLNKIFGGYHLKHLDLNKIHEIDSASGAFYLLKKNVLSKVNGFDDKNFFFYGEDLDLSYRIKEAGYKIIYYPNYTVLHLKYASGLNKPNHGIREQTKDHFYEAMKIFYHKHYEKRHFWIVNQLVYFFINLKKKIS